MGIFVDGFGALLQKRFTQQQVEEIKGLLETYSLGFEINPISTAISTNVYELPRELALFMATKQQNGRMSARSFEQYYSCLSKMLYEIALPLQLITVNHLRVHLYHISTDKRNGKPLAKATLNQRKSMIRSFFKWLQEEGYIDTDPSVRIKRVAENQRPREAYKDTQIEHLRNACSNKRDKAIIDVFNSTGIRVAELCELNRNSVDMLSREIIVHGKGDKWRKVYMDARAVVSLQDYLDSRKDNSDALFVSTRHPFNRLHTSGVRRTLKKISETTNVNNVIPHRFRHTLATSCVKNGMPIESVQVLLGHTNLSTTMRYTHIANEKIKRDYEMYMS